MTKIFVVDAENDLLRDSLDSVAACLASALLSARESERERRRPRRNNPPQSRWACNCTAPLGGVAGYPPEDDNKRFGAGFEIDEPRAEEYNQRWMFESDHAAYDRFVEAGKDCVARGLEKKTTAPIHKVNAFRRRIEDGPVLGVNLVGESHWF